jgi:hypothetical protein
MDLLLLFSAHVVIVALKIINDFSFLSPNCFISVFVSFKEMETQNGAGANIVPVAVAACSKAKVCGRSPAEIVGSNPTGVMDVCLLWVLCVVR